MFVIFGNIFMEFKPYVIRSHYEDSDENKTSNTAFVVVRGFGSQWI